MTYDNIEERIERYEENVEELTVEQKVNLLISHVRYLEDTLLNNSSESEQGDT